MPGALTIARATEADRAPVLELLAAQLADHGLPTERLGAAVDGVLRDPARGALLLGRLDGAAVGVAYVSWIWSLEHGGRSAWLDELYVVPRHRGRGVGRALLLAALDLARAERCAAVDLEVDAGHARAARLYQREGFRPHARARWVREL